MSTKNSSLANYHPLFSDDEDIIDGTADDPPIDSLAKGNLSGRNRRLVLAAASSAVFVNACMMHVTAPVAPDFLRSDQTSMNVQYGIMFAASSFGSLISLVPIWTIGKADEQGGLSLLLLAFVTWTVSAVLAAAASWQREGSGRYIMMIISRLINGIGSSAGTTAVVAVIWSAFHDDTRRSKALASTLLFYALGEAVGPLFSGAVAISGVLSGWRATFFTLASVIACLGAFAYFVRERTIRSGVVLRRPTYLDDVSWRKVVTDPFIVVLMLAYLLVEVAMSFVLTILPTWMLHSFHPEPKPWQIALLLLPKTVGLLLLTPLIMDHLPAVGKWRLTSASILLTSLCMLSLTLITSHQKVGIVVLPALGLGIGIAMLDGSVFPVVSNLLGHRHRSNYGVIRTLNATALHVAYTLGPFFSSLFAELVGYDWSFYGMGMVLAMYSPFLIVMKPFEEHFHLKHGHAPYHRPASADSDEKDTDEKK